MTASSKKHKASNLKPQNRTHFNVVLIQFRKMPSYFLEMLNSSKYQLTSGVIHMRLQCHVRPKRKKFEDKAYDLCMKVHLYKIALPNLLHLQVLELRTHSDHRQAVFLHSIMRDVQASYSGLWYTRQLIKSVLKVFIWNLTGNLDSDSNESHPLTLFFYFKQKYKTHPRGRKTLSRNIRYSDIYVFANIQIRQIITMYT